MMPFRRWRLDWRGKKLAAIAANLPENWRGVAAASVGAKHLKATPPAPCQDAALIRSDGASRPCAFVADGAGSALLSHLGANAAVLRLSHLTAALEDVHAHMLDAPKKPREEEMRAHARRFLIHAAETLRDLATTEKNRFKEFHCTLLLAVAGAARIFWLKVGDGHIVCERNRATLEVIGPSGKGEYANVTNFIEENPAATTFTAGFLPAAGISGLALMTDGAGEKLVSNDNKRVAARLSHFFSAIRNAQFGKEDLQNFLADAKIWSGQGVTGDDKGIALLSQLGK